MVEIKHLTEYRDPKAVEALVARVRAAHVRPVQFMEVCGTHTVAISRYGLRDLLPKTIRLLSGPGCPVCVTPNADIDWAIEAANRPEVIMTTFGDMMKVPGSHSSFLEEKAEGADIRMVYSTTDALQIARENPDRTVIFFGVGFETTTPTLAIALQEAKAEGLGNFFVYAANKTVPKALRALATADDVRIDGFILPGHVSVIIGVEPYAFLADEFKVPCVITGFEPTDVLGAIAMLVEQVENTNAKVEIEYTRMVRPEGNPVARAAMAEVFVPCDSVWRGIGPIPGTGLTLSEAYADFDARGCYDIEVTEAPQPPGCSCGDILRGVLLPNECPMYGLACTPEHPVGPCMVSSEGSCAAYYRYSGAESG